ncbi:MAG TPA: hypothetical protein VLT33_08370 [Labilithrix sp.]|nr:hypothetical protein [Labilithrix sp.]
MRTSGRGGRERCAETRLHLGGRQAGHGHELLARAVTADQLHVSSRKPEEVAVRLPGGVLYVTILEDGRAIMRGPARHVFSGQVTA